MPRIILTESTRKGKRFMVILPDGKKVHFGAEDGETYLEHKDDDKKEAWLARHGSKEMNEDWSKDGMHTAGFYSRWLLWNKKTLRKSIKDVRKRFGLHIIKARKVST